LFLSYELHFAFYYGFKIPSFVGKDFLRDIIAYRNVVVVYEGKLCCNLCKYCSNLLKQVLLQLIGFLLQLAKVGYIAIHVRVLL